MNIQNGWELEKVFFNQKDFFTHLLKGLAEAEVSIDFETYIFVDDELGQKVCESLKNAALRGIRVRALIDGWGSPLSAWNLIPQLRRAGVDARIYHPLRKFAMINKRNHRKICAIDTTKVWAGGMNVCYAHASWRDSGVYVVGDLAKNFSVAFENSWQEGWWQGHGLKKIATKLKTKLKPSHWVRLNQGRIERRKSYRRLLLKIAETKKRAFITNAYFVPTRQLLKALILPAQNNVDVRLLLPHTSDIFFMTWVSAIYYYPLLKAGVRIFEYLPAPLHAKTMILDDWAIIGSSNLNHRSLLHDLEGDVVLSQSKTIKILEEQFMIDLAQSREITIKEWYNRPMIARIFGRVLYYLRNWM